MSPRFPGLSIAMLFMGMFTADAAGADSLRCGRRLVSDGDSSYQVRSVCGEPDAAVQRREFRTERRWVPGPCREVHGKKRCGAFEEATIEVVVDEWTYDFGRNRFIQFLTFEQGRLIRVESGSYGNNLLDDDTLLIRVPARSARGHRWSSFEPSRGRRVCPG